MPLSQRHIFIKDNQLIHKVALDSILFVESLDDYCIIKTTSSIRTNCSLSDIYDILPPDRFAKIHQRFIISLEFVDGIDLTKSEVFLKDYTVPMESTYKNTFLKKINIL